MVKNRLEWSRKRVITLAVASVVSALLVGCFTAQQIWAGQMTMHPTLLLTTIANVVQWCAYLAATVRDEFRHELATTLREEIRTEVGKLLKPIDSKIEEIDADVHEYGDRRQAEGTALGLRIAGQRGNGNGRHLNPVD